MEFRQHIKHLFLSVLLLTSPCVCFAAGEDMHSTRPDVFVPPTLLNWQAMSFPTIDYARTPVSGGAALYGLENTSTLRSRLVFVFPIGIYSFPKEDVTALMAFCDLLLKGGAGTKNYDEIQKILRKKGIALKTELNSQGFVQISGSALSEDFETMKSLMADVILKPLFSKQALALWKQESLASFDRLRDANTLQKQSFFMDTAAWSLAFGPEHEFAAQIKRISPAAIHSVQEGSVHKIYKSLLNRKGLNVFLEGSFSAAQKQSVLDLMMQIPVYLPVVNVRLPERHLSTSSKIKALLIRKKDTSQLSITLRSYLPHLGKLNTLDQTRFLILKEVFSSSGGTIGHDRFSKALRADTGISYSPRASFDPYALFPSTNVGLFEMNFQSPNERVHEAVMLAQKTWSMFLNEGPSAEELERARISLMNRLMGMERTVFDIGDELHFWVQRGELPSTSPLESALVKLSQEKDRTAILDTLSQWRAGAVPVLVMMGNPAEEQIRALEEEGIFEKIEIQEFDAFMSAY